MALELASRACLLRSSVCRRSVVYNFPLRALLPSRLPTIKQFSSLTSRPQDTEMHPLDFNCEIAAEQITRYRPGGYHPVALGDLLHKKRYKIVHKLGWGSYSTIWLALDSASRKFVALKICASDLSRTGDGEPDVLKAVTTSPGGSRPPVVNFLDSFQIQGPNGTHQCIALEPLGPSISHLFYDDGESKLPRSAVKAAAYQILQAVDHVNGQGFVYGDLHPGNIALDIPRLRDLGRDNDFTTVYGKPVTSKITRTDGQALNKHFPPYIVAPAHIPTDLVREALNLDEPSFKLIDFGQAFLASRPPAQTVCPLGFTAPEIIFGEKIDQRVDLWSTGCMLLALVTGRSPFEEQFDKRLDMITKVVHYCPSELPPRWDADWREMPWWEMPRADDYCKNLEEWIERKYEYSGKAEEGLSAKDLREILRLAKKLIRVNPEEGATLKEILHDTWFQTW